MADAKPSDPKPSEAKKPRVVPTPHVDRLVQAEFRRFDWHYDVEHGTLPEDLKRPEYWAPLSHTLKRNHIIHCVWEDGSGYAECHVLASGHGWVKVHVARHIQYEQIDPESLGKVSGYRVRYVNNFAQWCVVRESDKQTIKDKCETEREAHIWLADHLKSLAA